MSYFRASFETILNLARSQRRGPQALSNNQHVPLPFEIVAGFLVLARHADGRSLGQFGPYRISGGGANVIHEKVGIGEESARAVMKRLRDAQVIQFASLEAKAVKPYATFEVLQGELNLDLPHAFVDRPKHVPDSILKRIRSLVKRPAELTGCSTSELRLDMLMMVIAIYRHTHMLKYGGLDPSFNHRPWNIRRLKPADVLHDTTRWGGEPQEGFLPDRSFWSQCLPHVATDDPALEHRIANAWNNVRSAGLIYEAVSLYDSQPTDPDARLQLTLRVNDYHAGSANPDGDPAFLRDDHKDKGFYIQPKEGERVESMWVALPQHGGHIVGVWRPRFRPHNSDTGKWIQSDQAAITSCLEQMQKPVATVR
ncbi:hypothetical protein [Variovorax sp. OV329]|uniref:hypothetical protein n=1 Tax=Variovorax sp. OV329 TaxID=1882825 RepID=UPI0008F21DF0|nr:hypothetical protein [Variovorax sp. OV329]SFM91705.1 hypothetical protein SAMN05444747_11114 [Variovorax sp. OV329]